MPRKSNHQGDRRLQGCSAAERDVYDHYLTLQHASRKAGRGHWVRPRQATIAAALGLARETVCRAVKELTRRGLLMSAPRHYQTDAGEVRRAANRVYVFVARTASAVAQFLAGKGRKPLQSADCDIALTERAERSIHQRGPIEFSVGKTAFLLAWEARKALASAGGER